MCGTIDDMFSAQDRVLKSGLNSKPSDLFKASGDFAGGNLKRIEANDPYLSAIGTGVASYFGGPWGAAGAATSNAKERGETWDNALSQGALAGGISYLGGELGKGADSSSLGAEGGVDYGDGSSFSAGDGSAYSTPASTGSSVWEQPSTGFEGSATPEYTGYDTGAVDLSGNQNLQDLTATDGSPTFSLKDWLKGNGSKMGQYGRMQMLSGGLKTLGGIYDYGEKNRQADALMDRYNQQNAALDQYYAAGSPEAKAMEEQLARQDAAAGRRSQYGTRAVNLAAQLAQTRANYRAQMAPGLNQLYGQAQQLRGSAPAGIYGGLSQGATGYGLSSMF